MSTTSSIGTASRNYSTLAAWLSAFTPSGWIGQCYNDSEFVPAAQVAFNQSTSVANFITLQTAAGQGFKDNASVQSNGLPGYNQANGVGIKAGNYSGLLFITVGNVTIEYLQIFCTSSSYGTALRIDTNPANVVIQQNILQSNGTGANAGIFEVVGSSTFVNNFVIFSTSNGGQGVRSAYHSPSFINNTVVNPSSFPAATNGIWQDGASALCVNNAVFGFGTANFTAIGGGGSFSGNNNASDAAIGFGTSNQASLTYANQFVGVTSGSPNFIPKTGSALIDNGATESTFTTTDIVGTTRPQGSAWDIGCWEYISTGTNVNLNAVSGAGATGSFTPSLLLTLALASGVGKAAALTPQVAAQLTTVSGVGTVGSVIPADSFTLVRASGLGAVGGFIPNVLVNLAIASGVGQLGNLGTSPAYTLTFASGAGKAGTFTPSLFLTLAPASGFGGIGTLVPSVGAHSFARVSGQGVASGFGVQISIALTTASGSGFAVGFPFGTVNFPPVSGAGLVTGFVPQISIPLSLVSGVGTVAGFVPRGQTAFPFVSGTGLSSGFTPVVSVNFTTASGAGLAETFTPNLLIPLQSVAGIGLASGFHFPTGTNFPAVSGLGLATAFLGGQILFQLAPGLFTFLGQPLTLTLNVPPGTQPVCNTFIVSGAQNYIIPPVYRDPALGPLWPPVCTTTTVH